MTSPTQRPTLSPDATKLLFWLAAGSPRDRSPPFIGDQPAFSAAIDELHHAGLARRTANDGAWTASNAGLEEAARLEEDAARAKAGGRRHNLSPLATDALRWIAGGRKAPAPGFAQSRDGYMDLIGELHTAGLSDAMGHLSEAGYAEAARLEEEANRQPARPAPAPPAEEPPPDSTEGAIPIPFDKNATAGEIVLDVGLKILAYPIARKAAASFLDRFFAGAMKAAEQKYQAQKEAEKPAPATTERRTPKKGRRRRG